MPATRPSDVTQHVSVPVGGPPLVGAAGSTVSVAPMVMFFIAASVASAVVTLGLAPSMDTLGLSAASFWMPAVALRAGSWVEGGEDGGGTGGQCPRATSTEDGRADTPPYLIRSILPAGRARSQKRALDRKSGPPRHDAAIGIQTSARDGPFPLESHPSNRYSGCSNEQAEACCVRTREETGNRVGPATGRGGARTLPPHRQSGKNAPKRRADVVGVMAVGGA